ncbi:MAG: hypothetical protein ACO3J6_11385 [Opitutales bacterium]
MKVPTWMFVVVAIIAAILIWRRTQEGLRPEFTPRCKELLALPVARIFTDALIPDRKEDALEKFNELKDKLDEQALLGNKLATECRLIVDNLMKQLREDNMEGFSDGLKKLLI